MQKISNGEPYPTEEFLNDWLARTAEIILNYKPSLLYFDWWVQHQGVQTIFKETRCILLQLRREMGKR